MRFKRRKLEVSPPYVSMADIAFNLVLFFLILAKTQDDSHIQWEPVKAVGMKEVSNSRITIKVDKDYKTYLNGKEVGIRDLGDLITAELENNAPGNRIVLLKIHKEAPAATFEKILEAVSQAGCEVYHVLEEVVER